MPTLCTILLIEDHSLDAESVMRSLRSADGEYLVKRTSGLTEAIRVLHAREVEPDVILLDLGLPDSAGRQSVDALRELGQETPLIVLTGWDDAFAGALRRAGPTTISRRAASAEAPWSERSD